MLINLIRTLAQATVAFAVSYAAGKGLNLTPDVQAALVVLLTGLIASGQTALEHKFPKLGALLRTPSYATAGEALMRIFARELGKQGVKTVVLPSDVTVADVAQAIDNGKAAE